MNGREEWNKLRLGRQARSRSVGALQAVKGDGSGKAIWGFYLMISIFKRLFAEIRVAKVKARRSVKKSWTSLRW